MTSEHFEVKLRMSRKRGKSGVALVRRNMRWLQFFLYSAGARAVKLYCASLHLLSFGVLKLLKTGSGAWEKKVSYFTKKQLINEAINQGKC